MRAGAIDAYIAELGAALRGPRRAKRDLLTEARDGLVDATEAYRDGGCDRQAAERAAVRDFGTLDEVVPGYQAELGWAQGRRTALIVLFTFAAQPFIWGYAFRWVTNLPNAEPQTGTATADSVVENLGGVTILVALIAVLAYRIGMRYPAVRGRITRITGIAGLVVSTVFIALGLLLTVLTVRPGQVVVNLVWTVAFIVLPMAWIAVSGRRCLAMSQPGQGAARRP